MQEPYELNKHKNTSSTHLLNMIEENSKPISEISEENFST